MDTKLTNFLTKRNLAGSIGDEFLQLLMWGKPKYGCFNCSFFYLVKLSFFIVFIVLTLSTSIFDLFNKHIYVNYLQWCIERCTDELDNWQRHCEIRISDRIVIHINSADASCELPISSWHHLLLTPWNQSGCWFAMLCSWSSITISTLIWMYFGFRPRCFTTFPNPTTQLLQANVIIIRIIIAHKIRLTFINKWKIIV